MIRFRRLFARNRRRFVWSGLAALLVPVTAANLSADSPFVGALALNLYTELLGAVLIVQFGLEFLLRRRDVELLPGLPKQDILTDSRTARKQVEIYETFSMLPTDHDGTTTLFELSVTEALANGAKVRVLVLAPNSAGLAERAHEIGRMLPVDELARQNFRSFHRLLHGVATGRIHAGDRADRLMVRLIEEKPPSTVYVVDDVLYHAPFPRAGRADVSQNLRIKITGTGSIGHHYRETFLEEWERSAPTTLEARTMAELVGVADHDYPVYAVFDWSTEVLYVAWVEAPDRRTARDYPSLMGRFRDPGPTTVRLFGVAQEWQVKLDQVVQSERPEEFARARRALDRRYGVASDPAGTLRILGGPLPGYVAVRRDPEGEAWPLYHVEHEDRRYVTWYGPGDHWLDCRHLTFPSTDEPARATPLALTVGGADLGTFRLVDAATTGVDRYALVRLFVDRYGFSFFTSAAIYEAVPGS